MIIYSNNSIIKYDSTQILNLIQQPPPGSANNLYLDYNNFIRSVDTIYGTQKADGSIPIFKTKFDTITNRVIADPNSTLRFLIPGESYAIRINSDSDLPLRVPNPIGLEEFAGESNNNTITNSVLSCNPNISINSIISLTNNNAYLLTANINNATTHEKYYYEFTPIFSNWPATITPRSGEIVITSSAGPNSRASGYITALFDYKNSLSDVSSSIPYILDKNLGSSYYNKNIFSIVNLSIYSNNTQIYDKNITILCKQCVDNHSCPSTTTTISGTGVMRYITTTFNNLDKNTTYTYSFDNINSNWSANISPLSGTVKASNDSSAIIYNVFKYCEINDTNCNLPISDISLSTDPLVTPKLYTNLVLNLKSDNNLCSVSSDPILLECDRCFIGNNFTTKIIFDIPPYPVSSTEYPELADGYKNSVGSSLTNRPRNEYNLYNHKSPYIRCCENPAILKMNITDAIPGDRYIYNIYSYPPITIVPNTGTISFGNGSGTMSVLAYMEQEKSSSIHVTLTHEKSTKQASDATIVRCPQPW